MILTALALLLSGTNLLCAPMDGRILVLNFECSGVANGYSDAIGDSLRSHIVKLGGQVVSHNLFEQLIRSRGKTESDLNFMPDEIKSILPQLNGQGAVYGQVYMSHGMLTMDMKYIEGNLPAPIIINPFVVGNLKDLYNVIPEAAYIILSPDKESPSVISVSPSDNSDKLDEYLDMKISFSEPMNPETFSLKAKPARCGAAMVM